MRLNVTRFRMMRLNVTMFRMMRLNVKKIWQLLTGGEMKALLKQYADYRTKELSYATVQDFSDSIDNFPSICGLNGDLKNVQRPWIIKAIIANLPPSAKLLEIGGGEPIVAGILANMGYDVTIIDPYDGTGNGPTEYDYFKEKYKNIKFIREYFTKDQQLLQNKKFDCIYSISVLEHVPEENIEGLFDACKSHIKDSGVFIHAIDHVLLGDGQQSHEQKLSLMLKQLKLDDQLDQLFKDIRDDVEAYYLSAEGHLFWKGSTPYRDFPFRRVVSINVCKLANLGLHPLQ